MPAHPLSRRDFLVTSSAALTGLAFDSTSPAATPPPGQKFAIITFTKPFQTLSFDETADLVAEVGYHGIECPVRKNGQVLPERVEDDLPKLQSALKRRQLDLTLLATDVGSVTPLHEKLLRTAAALGVKRYRLTSFHYDLNKPIPPQLAEIKSRLRDVAALNKQLGIYGGIQNHSGRDNVGAPIWDIHQLVADIDPAHLGICFDIGHATLEGGYSWQIQAKLMEPLLTAVFVKDFSWKKNATKGWAADWGPLGEGMVNRKFFDWLKTTSYKGPISQHCEYLKGGGPEERAQMKKDLAVLQSWLS